MQGQRYTNGVLTAIAALLGLNLAGQALDRGHSLAPEAGIAHAQPEQYRRDGAATPRSLSVSTDPTEGGMISAAEQRKLMLAELRTIVTRLSSIEQTLGSGISVTVTDMPPVEMQGGQAGAQNTGPNQAPNGGGNAAPAMNAQAEASPSNEP